MRKKKSYLLYLSSTQKSNGAKDKQNPSKLHIKNTGNMRELT